MWQVVGVIVAVRDSVAVLVGEGGCVEVEVTQLPLGQPVGVIVDVNSVVAVIVDVDMGVMVAVPMVQASTTMLSIQKRLLLVLPVFMNLIVRFALSFTSRSIAERSANWLAHA